jgi:hypothetical protein
MLDSVQFGSAHDLVEEGQHFVLRIPLTPQARLPKKIRRPPNR